MYSIKIVWVCSIFCYWILARWLLTLQLETCNRTIGLMCPSSVWTLVQSRQLRLLCALLGCANWGLFSYFALDILNCILFTKVHVELWYIKWVAFILVSGCDFKGHHSFMVFTFHRDSKSVSGISTHPFHRLFTHQVKYNSVHSYCHYALVEYNFLNISCGIKSVCLYSGISVLFIFLVQAIQVQMQQHGQEPVSFADVKDEIFDMVRPADPLHITLQDLILRWLLLFW